MKQENCHQVRISKIEHIVMTARKECQYQMITESIESVSLTKQNSEGLMSSSRRSIIGD